MTAIMPIAYDETAAIDEAAAAASATVGGMRGAEEVATGPQPLECGCACNEMIVTPRVRAGDGGRWWEMVGDGGRWWEMVGEGVRWCEMVGYCGALWGIVGDRGRSHAPATR